ncbi:MULTISPECIES: DUF4352 domain-containing protein [unclassified Streptomyces]|uniref:DUF4352 domain-containing protein n=1 Tax=unclassified Streptomyces TaxID=2593676 RepID=UPI0033AD01A8
MRRTTTITLTALVCLGVLTACGGPQYGGSAPEVKASADSGGESAAAAEKPKAEKPSVAKVGDTVTLKGMEDGEQLAVTLKKIEDPAKSKDEFFAPEDGSRWVGAQFELVNTGTKVYADSPGNGAQVADADGQRFGTTLADITAGPSMTSGANVPPGEKVLGWVVFEVPKASKLATVQFAMNSGFADQTGQWKLDK